LDNIGAGVRPGIEDAQEWKDRFGGSIDQTRSAADRIIMRVSSSIGFECWRDGRQMRWSLIERQQEKSVDHRFATIAANEQRFGISGRREIVLSSFEAARLRCSDRPAGYQDAKNTRSDKTKRLSTPTCESSGA